MKTGGSVFRSVLHRSRALPEFPGPSRRYWRFVATVTALLCAAYVFLLFFVTGFGELLAVLTLCYSAVTVIAISAGHQAFHGSLFSNARRSKRFGIATFIPLGIDGELWRLRHLRDHHPKPNTEGHDADLDNPWFFRLAPYTEYRCYHRYQHLYAPFVYSLAVIVTIFGDDFRAVVRECRALPRAQRTRIAAAFALRKLLFAGFWFVLPLLCNPAVGALPLLMAFCLATIPAAWIFLPIAAAHLNEHTSFFPEDSGEEFSLLQAETTVDFSSDSRLMTMLYGGLNCHLAHHLWPKVSSCHYGQMYNLLERSDPPDRLRPRNLGLLELIQSHFRFLRGMGVAPLSRLTPSARG